MGSVYRAHTVFNSGMNSKPKNGMGSFEVSTDQGLCKGSTDLILMR